MLHELTHNIHGPHQAPFYKLLDEITAECEELMAKGISGSGQGFDARSQGRLGGRGPVAVHNPPARRLREVMVKAAEERANRQAVMVAGPQRVGGDASLARSLTPAQAAAMAAERRARDNVWCPCGELGTAVEYDERSSQVVQVGGPPPGASSAAAAGARAAQPGLPQQLQSSSAAGEDRPQARADARGGRVQQVAGRSAAAAPAAASGPVDTRQTRAPPQSGPGRPGPAGTGAANRRQPAAGVPARPGQPAAPSSRQVAPGAIALIDLTGSDDEDAAAGTSAAGTRIAGRQAAKRPRVPTASGPAAQATGEAASAGRGGAGQWACRVCTLVNPASSSTCEACGSWRYSTGAPAASRPTLGGSDAT